MEGSFPCANWRGGLGGPKFDGVWGKFWYSPKDSLSDSDGRQNSGWYSHECQIPLSFTFFQSAKPGRYPMPMPKVGIGFGQVAVYHSTILWYMNRGFIAQLLQDTLLAGQEYCVEFYTRPFSWSTAVTKNIGAYFTADSIDYYAYTQNITPHLEAAQVISDTNVWTRVKGTYIANGTERFINLGNFRSDSASTMIPSGFHVDAWFVFKLPSYLVDGIMVYKYTDTLYTATLPPDTLLCPNQTLSLQPLLQGFLLEDTTTTFLWSTGSTDSSILVTQPGTYWVQTTINSRFLAADTIRVAYFPSNYTLGLPDTVTFCEGTLATLTANPDSTNLTAYIWSTGATMLGIQTQASGQFWLRANTPCGTLADTSWVLQDFCETHLWIPNAFTPDGDGTNDFFAFLGAPAPVALSIFDRWGKLVFYNPDYQNNWDGNYQGNPLPLGVYTYLIEYRYINPDATQPNPTGSERQKRGTVTLLR